MSLKTTKQQLVKLLADSDNRVIALTGKWGTGKSFMWGEVKAASVDPRVVAALSASLFGLSSIEQVKVKLLQSALPSLQNHPGMWKGTKQAVKSGIKVLEGFHKGFAALNDLGLVLAPALFRQKLIVLDDVERKHDKLNVHEVLGFINEFTLQHESRFVLILNSDQLEDRKDWDILREKVVDQELCLKTSPAEAFDIALGLTPSTRADRIGAAVEVCGVTNIRIIRKVIKTVNRILGDRQNLTEAVLSRVIPSAVLLSAIHYKGIEDGPDFNFVLGQGNDLEEILAEQNEEEQTEESKLKTKWRLLVRELGISYCDQYELLVVDFLESGLCDSSKIAAIIDRYVADDDVLTVRNNCNKFFEDFVWNHRLTEDYLLAEGTALATKSHLLDAHFITALHEHLSELPGGIAVADAALDRWIGAFKGKNVSELEVRTAFLSKLHPRIKDELNSINTRAQANTTVLDACKSIAKNNGWGTLEEAVLKSATSLDMERIIVTSTIPDLKLFMGKMLDLCARKESYTQHFGTLMDNFVQACRNIIRDPDSGRLGKLIKLLFSESKLEKELRPTEVECAVEKRVE